MAPNTRSVIGTIPNSSKGGTSDSNLVDDNVHQLLGELVDERMSRLERAMEGLSSQVFFNLDQVTDEEKVNLISIHLYDKALLWHCKFIKNHEGLVSWEVYKQAVLARFSNIFYDPISEFKNLKYETSTKENEDAFDDLFSRVEINEGHAIGVSRRRLSQKEYAEKRAQNLCFYDDQKYVPGHKCSCQLYSLTVLPEEEMKTEEFLDVDESLVDLDSSDLPTSQISLNALTGTNNFKTMRVLGTVGKHVLHILVDCGSTHNFLDKGMAKRLGCNIKTTCPLAVTVTGGNHLASDGKCKDFKWHFGNTLFTTDIMLLSLGGCDMVSGIHWLATLGDIKCNFKELRMEFKYNGKGVALRGTKKTNVEWIGAKATDKALKQMAHEKFHSMALCMIPQGDVFCMQMEGSTIVIDLKIQEVLAFYEDMFDVPTALPPLREHDHRMPLIEGDVTVNIRPYKHPPAQKDAIKSMVKELPDVRVIKKEP
ncbi:reverse transcriptase [Tanacetum coccineum]